MSFIPQIQPLDMLTHRRTSYEEPVHTASYPTMVHAEPVFMEPTEARRALYPTELHAKPHYVSPDETQR